MTCQRLVIVLVLVLALVTTSPALADDRQNRNLLLDQIVEKFDGAALIERFVDAMLKGFTGERMIDDAALAELPAEERLAYEEEREKEREMRRAFREKVVLHLDAEEVAVQVLRPLLDETYATEELSVLLEFLETNAGMKTAALFPEMTTRLTSDLMFGESSVLREAFTKAENEMAKEGTSAGAPAKRTMADMRSMATASEAYAVDNERYPDADTLDELAGFVSPTYIKHLPREDGWGNEYRYIVSADGMHYRFVSAGADGVFAWDSLVSLDEVQLSRPTQFTSEYNDDLIYQDGSFLQYPKAANR